MSHGKITNDPLNCQDGYKMGTRWVQDGYKMGTRWVQDGYKMGTRLVHCSIKRQLTNVSKGQFQWSKRAPQVCWSTVCARVTLFFYTIFSSVIHNLPVLYENKPFLTIQKWPFCQPAPVEVQYKYASF